MKIIKKGISPVERIYRATCYQCGTIFEFKQGEGKVTYDQRDGNYVSISCPVCSNRCHIDVSDYIKNKETSNYWPQ